MKDADSGQENAACFALGRNPAPSSSSITIVLPIFNEEDSICSVIDETVAALSNFDHEIIVVDDGSTDGTLAALSAAKDIYPRLRVLRHACNAGKSRAIRNGVLAARGAIVATLDGDGQNDPADIPRLMNLLEDRGERLVALAAGERATRYDTAAKKIASRLANAVRRRLLQDGAADTGCGLKVFRRDAFLRLPYFDNMHRYLPALMRREGFEAVFAPVKDRPRVHGRSKYTNLGRFLVGIVDLFGVCWLMTRARAPGPIREERE